MIDDLVHGALSHVGAVRSENQDRCDVYVATDRADVGRRGSLYVVCDGMGGHNGGSIASGTAVEAMLDAWRRFEGSGLKKRLALAVDAANAAVRTKAAADVSLRNMGTTLVAIAVRGDRAQVAHIGDSRCYLFRDGKAEQLTRDHTYLNDLIEIGLLTPEKARHHPERNIITRCIGMGDSLQTDFRAMTIRPGDRFLLCTDGLYNYLEPEELLKESLERGPKEAADRLVAIANARGGEDNITCLVVRVEKAEPSAESADDDEPPATRPQQPTTVVVEDPDAPTPIRPTPAAAYLGGSHAGPDVGRELTTLAATQPGGGAAAGAAPTPTKRSGRRAFWTALVVVEAALVLFLLRWLEII
jgi:serine/threonine protein phosphatase PrpC